MLVPFFWGVAWLRSLELFGSDLLSRSRSCFPISFSFRTAMSRFALVFWQCALAVARSIIVLIGFLDLVLASCWCHFGVCSEFWLGKCYLLSMWLWWWCWSWGFLVFCNFGCWSVQRLWSLWWVPMASLEVQWHCLRWIFRKTPCLFSIPWTWKVCQVPKRSSAQIVAQTNAFSKMDIPIKPPTYIHWRWWTNCFLFWRGDWNLVPSFHLLYYC